MIEIDRTIGNLSPVQRDAISSIYVRDDNVTKTAKEFAHGICQLCGNRAPFDDKYGIPYLECHHIQWLSQGGADSLDNTIAICPNCHRKMHILDDEGDKKKLREKITARYHSHITLSSNSQEGIMVPIANVGDVNSDLPNTVEVLPLFTTEKS